MPRRVDIFIPAKQTPDVLSQAVPQQGLGKANSMGNDVRAPQKRPALDHLRPRYPRPLPPPVVPVRREFVKPLVQATHATEVQEEDPAPHSPVKKHRVRTALVLALLGTAVLVVGNLLQAAIIGELLIGAYAVFALVRRIESRTTFMLALVSLGCILVLLVTRPDPALMRNFAIYAFLFMLVGTVSLTREVRQ